MRKITEIYNDNCCDNIHLNVADLKEKETREIRISLEQADEITATAKRIRKRAERNLAPSFEEKRLSDVEPNKTFQFQDYIYTRGHEVTARSSVVGCLWVKPGLMVIFPLSTIVEVLV